MAVPLRGTSKHLTLDPSFPPRVRLAALYASKVASANALEDVRQSIVGVLSGETTPAAAATRLRERFAGDDAAGSLLTPGRAEAIIRQQAMMAYAVGERQVGMDPDVMAFFPYWKYVATQDGRTRDTHAALDGVILPKTDPFWRTHTPPWEFGCRCALVDADEDEAREAGVAKAATHEQPDGGQSVTLDTADGRLVNLPGRTDSGFVFEPDAAFTQSDMGAVRELKSRRQILSEMTKAAQQSGVEWHFVAQPSTQIVDPVMPREQPQIAEEIARVAAGETASVDLGKLLPAHADGLGLAADEHDVRLSATPPGGKYGVGHWQKSHADTFADPVGELKETLWQPGCEARLSVHGGRTRILLWNRRTNHLATFVKHGRGWELETVDVWEPSVQFRKAKALQ